MMILNGEHSVFHCTTLAATNIFRIFTHALATCIILYGIHGRGLPAFPTNLPILRKDIHAPNKGKQAVYAKC